VGRLAIDRFLEREPLDRLIGRVHGTAVGGREVAVIPLPHPSGASSWVNLPANRVLLDHALDHLQRAFLRLGVGQVQSAARQSA
jgi:uracil-DNA glycosylase